MGSLQSVNMETLLRHTFVPDYSVRAVTEVLYIKIKRSLYMAAKRATLMERSQKDNTISSPGDQFDDEVEKVSFPTLNTRLDVACLGAENRLNLAFGELGTLVKHTEV